MSFILNIDTSLETASVSLANNGKILASQINDVQKEHASFVHVAIQSLLIKKNLLAKDLAAIAVTIGPGSYTGLRVGLAAAKGLCYALKIPLIAISTLQMMAKDVITNNENLTDSIFCPLIDARRMEVFTALYDMEMKELNEESAIVLKPQTFATILTKKNILFFGSGMEKWKNICNHDNAMFTSNINLTNSLNIISFNKFLAKDFADLTYTVPQYTKAFYNP